MYSYHSVYFNERYKPFSRNKLILFVQVRLINHFAPVCNRVLIVCWLVNMLINGYISTQCLNVWAEILNAFTSYFFNDTSIQRRAEDKKQTHLYVIINLVLLHSIRAEHPCLKWSTAATWRRGSSHNSSREEGSTAPFTAPFIHCILCINEMQTL